MPPPDRIPVPTSITAIVRRWQVFFSLMSEDAQLLGSGPLALFRDLSRKEHSPDASLEDLALLYAFVEARLDATTEELPHLVMVEAFQVCNWLRPYLGPGEDWTDEI